MTDIREAVRLAEAGELDEALRITDLHLMDDPSDIKALTVLYYALDKAGKLTISYQIAKRLIEVEPSNAASWTNYGQAANALWRKAEAERAYLRGLKIAHDTRSRVILYLNLAALYVDAGDFKRAQGIIASGLELDPGNRKLLANLGFCQLAQRQWAEGWKNYHCALGDKFRKKTVYKGEPEWDGSHQTVALYGEQGIGDDICFASMLPDAIKLAKRVILDVDARVVGLFKRSFPACAVYGTKHATSGEPWVPEDREFECSLALAQIGEFTRLKDEDFHDQPYLVADPERMKQWKEKFQGKTIGIAWRGGIPRTGAKFRNLMLDDLLPIFKAVDAKWVSLQYKPSQKEIDAFRAKYPQVDLVEYPQATLTNDYDDTAGLVAALDLVISVPTTVVHLAGALGVPTIAMQSPFPCWKFYAGLPFHPKVRLVPHEENWQKTIQATALLI